MFTSRRQIIYCLTVFALLLTACQPIEWHTFTSTKGNFSILMPETPTESNLTRHIGSLGDIGFFNYKAKGDYGSFEVGYIDYPADKINKLSPYDVLDVEVNALSSYAVNDLKSTVSSAKSINWKNRFPGREFRAQSADGNVKAIGRVYLINARSYILVGNLPVNFTEDQFAEITKFLDSFDLLKS
jgi:hypothetical protein